MSVYGLRIGLPIDNRHDLVKVYSYLARAVLVHESMSARQNQTWRNQKSK